MATLSVWPALGTTVTLDDLTVIDSEGASVTYTAEIRQKIAAGFLLTYDPTGGEVTPDPATGLSTIYVTTLASLATVRGSADGQTAFVDDGMFVWNAASTATSDGVTIVGSGTGRWLRVFDGPYDPRWFGVAADGVTNDGTALRAAALSAAGTTGGELRLPHGTAVVGATSGGCVNLTRPLCIAGEGGIYTAINPSAAASTDHTITVTPNTGYDLTLMRFNGFALHNPSTGQRTGKHGIYLDTQVALAYLPKFTLRDVQFGTPSHADGYSVYHENNTTNNVNGGMYLATFENCVMKGGIRLSGSGDSINVLHNVMSGTNIGVNADLKSDASCLQIVGNNITTNNGAIRIGSGPRPRIIGNNIENYLAAGALAANDGAVVNITGTTGAVYGGVIKENLVSAYASTDATCCIRLANCRGTLVEDNVILSGGGAGDPTVGIKVESTATDCRIGANAFNVAITTQVDDSGVGTMGVVKVLSLDNSWVARSGTQHAFTYIKSSDGMVHVTGAIKDGTATNDIQIGTMPVGFRPALTVRAPATWEVAGTLYPGAITVESTGVVRLGYITTNTNVIFNFSYPASNLAHSVSPE